MRYFLPKDWPKKKSKENSVWIICLKIEPLIYCDYVLLFDRILEWLDRKLIGRFIGDWQSKNTGMYSHFN